MKSLNKNLLSLIDRNCPSWVKRPDPEWSKVKILQSIIDQVLPGLLKIEITHLDEDKITGSVPYQNLTANVLGYMHGGTIYSLGDTLAGAYLWANSDEKNFAVTRKSEIRFLRPIQSGVLQCTVRMKSKAGRKIFLQADYFLSGDKKVSEVLMEYALMPTKE